MELNKFLKEKPRRGWRASRRDLDRFTEILDNNDLNKEGEAKDEDGWTPLHHLAGRAQDPTPEHVKMFQLVRGVSVSRLTQHCTRLHSCSVVLTGMSRSAASTHARLSQCQG